MATKTIGYDLKCCWKRISRGVNIDSKVGIFSMEYKVLIVAAATMAFTVLVTRLFPGFVEFLRAALLGGTPLY